jgi:hypothetical protein
MTISGLVAPSIDSPDIADAPSTAERKVFQLTSSPVVISKTTAA